MSSGVPTRRTGVLAMWSCTVPPRRPRSSDLRSIGVSMKPGGTALTVMPIGPYSSASDLVSPFTAALAATYADMYGCPDCALDEELFADRAQRRVDRGAIRDVGGVRELFVGSDEVHGGNVIAA